MLTPETPSKTKLDVQFGDWVFRHHGIDMLTEVQVRAKTYSAVLTDYTRTVMVEPASLECCGVDLQLHGDQVYSGLDTDEPVVFIHSRLTAPPCSHWTYWRPPADG